MKYLKSKKGSLESSILSVWTEAAKKVNEKLVGGQKKLDKDKDGDIAVSYTHLTLPTINWV